MFKITNGNKFDFSAAYNGQTYDFPQGRTVACEEEAAAHIFGLDQRDKTGIMSRHGWITITGPKTDGLAILARFSFEAIDQKLDVQMARTERGPAPALQEADDEEGGADEPLDKSSAIRGRLGRRDAERKPQNDAL